MIDKNTQKLAQELAYLYEEAYEIYKFEVEKIINLKIRDINYIERTLDYILDIYTDKGFNLFMELLLYYRTVNEKNAKEYLEILKEQRGDEYQDFVKTIKKI